MNNTVLCFKHLPVPLTSIECYSNCIVCDKNFKPYNDETEYCSKYCKELDNQCQELYEEEYEEEYEEVEYEYDGDNEEDIVPNKYKKFVSPDVSHVSLIIAKKEAKEEKKLQEEMKKLEEKIETMQFSIEEIVKTREFTPELDNYLSDEDWNNDSDKYYFD